MTRATIVSSAFRREPVSKGGWGSYSIINWAASAAVRSTSSSTRAQGHVDTARDTGGRDDPPVEVFDHPLMGGHGSVYFELGVAGPVRRGREALEQSGGTQYERPGAYRCGEQGGAVGMAHPLETLSSCSKGRVPTPPGSDNGRLGNVFEGGVGGEAEHAVLTADLAALMAG